MTTTNGDQHQPPPSQSRYIDNLIFRTFRTLNSLTSNSEIPYPAIPIIKPALTPDMLSNTFGQWGPNEQFKEQENRIHDSDNSANNNNTNPSKAPPPPLSSSSLLSPDPSSSSSSSAKINEEEKARRFMARNHSSNESMHESIDQKKPVNLLPANNPRMAMISNPTDRKDQERRTSPSSSIRNHESSLKKTTTTLTSTVTIRIGRIEVKALLPKGFQQSSLSSSSTSQASQDSSGPHLTLQDYLKRRSEGRY
jgi:hypothetical protein